MAPDYHTRELNEYQEESSTSRPQPHHHRQATSSCFSRISTPNHVLHSSVEEQGGCFHGASQPSDRGLEALPSPIGITTYQKLEDQRVNEDRQKGHHEHGSSSSLPSKYQKLEDQRVNEDRQKGHHEHGSSSSLPSFEGTSSKMRMMRKMMISERRPSPNKSSAHKSEDRSYADSITSSCPQMVTNGGCSDSTTVRVCVDCNTSKTPLWRSGPRGPKTLCNACGIRQRKARRAMAATATAAASVAIVPPPTMTLPAKCKLKNKDNKRPGSKAAIDQESETIKKRFKLPSPTLVSHRETKELCLEDFATRLSKRYSANLQRVFPQEEKEAAILLMALSCGLVHG
ncbi:putative GATA transcription factor 22 isoform X1 [Syzygium oleosum]|uniref:putative GATA transcription factor 22 isoform X1 n=1 Tax=Syzygium oleosum TaxID=219896 RepID=UPI0024BBC0AD|nr:putative GATA transcription factor 22 isoform X1 [Syzygium oleosum]